MAMLVITRWYYLPTSPDIPALGAITPWQNIQYTNCAPGSVYKKNVKINIGVISPVVDLVYVAYKPRHGVNDQISVVVPKTLSHLIFKTRMDLIFVRNSYSNIC